MSSFKTIKTDKKGNIEKAAIMGGVAFYTKFKEPAVIYDEKDLPKAQQKNFEWTVEIVVSEDCADAYDETVSDKQSSKKLSKAQAAKKFRLVDDAGNIDDDKFKAANLDPSQKKFFVIKKAQRCQKRDGSPLTSLQPRAIQKVDGKNVDITFEKLIGNGSIVNLLMRYADQGSYGVSSYPDKMLVEELIEYETNGTGQGLSEEEQDFFGGDIELAEVPENAGKPSEDSDVQQEPPFEPDEQPDFGEEDDELY